MMDLYIGAGVIVALVIVIIVQNMTFYLDRRRYNRQNQDLLDRFMAGDYQTYAAGRRVQATTGFKVKEFLKWKKTSEDEQEKEQDGLPVT